MEAPNFWDDTETSQKKMKELKSYKDDVEVYRQLETSYEDIETLIEMGYEENDASIIPEIEEELNSQKVMSSFVSKYCYPASMTTMMQSSPCMQGQAEQSLVTGQQCSFECTAGGLRIKDIS